MKKIYTAPDVKVKKIEVQGMIAASPTIGGTANIGLGDKTSSENPSQGTSGDAKAFNVWDYMNVDDEE